MTDTEQPTGPIRNIEDLDCGCRLACDANDRQSLDYCPTHAAAPAMLATLRALVDAVDYLRPDPHHPVRLNRLLDAEPPARALLRTLERTHARQEGA